MFPMNLLRRSALGSVATTNRAFRARRSRVRQKLASLELLEGRQLLSGAGTSIKLGNAGKWIEVSALSWVGPNPVTTTPGSTANLAGKPSITGFEITESLTNGSNPFPKKWAAGEHFDTGTVELEKGNGSTAVELKIENVTLKSEKVTKASAENDVSIETVDFTYGSATIAPQAPTTSSGRHPVPVPIWTSNLSS